jgi:uncharacterized protein YjbI with pentapeptide repeats
MANPDHLTRLLGGVSAWNVWRDSQPLMEVDLRGADLSDLDLRGVDLWYAKLQGAQFAGSLLSGAVLDRADLTLARLVRCDVDGTIFTGATLLGTNFWGTDLKPALGLNPHGGWNVEETGAVAAERHEFDRRSFRGVDRSVRRVEGA